MKRNISEPREKFIFNDWCKKKDPPMSGERRLSTLQLDCRRAISKDIVCGLTNRIGLKSCEKIHLVSKFSWKG